MKTVEEMRKSPLLKVYKTPIALLFSFLLGCMFAINLVAIDKTCRIEDSDREYNIMKNSKLKNPELVVLIVSSPKNLSKRNCIRETWLKLKDRGQEHKSENDKFKIKHYFAIGGIGLSADEILHISSEQSRFDDILVLPVYDSYQNLTLKVIKSFEWLDEQFDYGLGYKYVLKCDDDSFVRLDHLAHEIQHLELMYLQSQLGHVISLTEDSSSPYIRTNVQVNKNESRNNLQLYWGYFSGKAQVKTKGKWKESNWIACDRYLPYALGGGYVLSKKLVTYMAKNVDYLRFYNSEDISVGLWLSSVRNILRIHDIRFDTEWISRGCQKFYLVTHNIPIKEMYHMYTNILEKNSLCTVENLKRNHYHYNWSLPTSQCCNK